VTRTNDSPHPDPSGARKGSHVGALCVLREGFARSPLAVAELRDGSTVRLQLRGELDMSTRPQVERALRRAEDSGAVVIELDLGGLTFMDSSGVHIALEAHDRAERQGHTLVLLEGADTVQRIFKLTGTEHLLGIRNGLREPQSGL
jgi:anti-sigma B factor antagonist